MTEAVWQSADEMDWPENGAAIKWRERGKEEWHHAVVDFVWCGIEPAIKLTSGKHIFPTLGDQWHLTSVARE